jgi:hypothetical protein
MKKRKTTLAEIYVLNQEICGGHSPFGELGGLLSMKMSILAKFRLNMLLESISPTVKRILEVRDEIVKEVFGEDLPIAGDPRANICEGRFQEFLSQEWEIEYKPLPLSYYENLEVGPEYRFIVNYLEDDK